MSGPTDPALPENILQTFTKVVLTVGAFALPNTKPYRTEAVPYEIGLPYLVCCL